MTFRKRLMTAALSGAIVLMMTGMMVSAAAGVLLGDVNADGEVTVMDATCIQRKLADLRVDDSYTEEAADVDGNGIIEMTDVTFIQRWTADMEVPYAIGVQPTAAPTERPTDSEGWGRDIFRP